MANVTYLVAKTAKQQQRSRSQPPPPLGALVALVSPASERPPNYINPPPYRLDTIQDFLCELGIKPHMYLVEIIIFPDYTGKSFSEPSFLHQLTHHTIRDFSLNSPKNTSSQHVVYNFFFCFRFDIQNIICT